MQGDVRLFDGTHTEWNTHRIRQQKDTELPSGIPNHIYSLPEEYNLEECGM